MRTLKQTLCALLLCVALTGALSAQQDSSTVPSQGKLQYRQMFENLDVSKITTGILYDKQFLHWVDISKFSGDSLSDTITRAQWRQAYSEIRNSFIGETPFPPVEVVDSISRSYRKRGIIPISVLAVKYNTIKPDALKKGLLKLQDGKLSEGANKSESPYQENTVLAVSAERDYSYSLTVTFVIDQAFCHGMNLGPEFYVDFGEYPFTNFRRVWQGQTVTIQYQSYGAKKIRLGQEGGLGIILPAASFKFWIRFAEIPVMSTSHTGPGYEAYIIYGAGNNTGKFKKPIIFVEGFDPTNDMGYEEIYLRINQNWLLGMYITMMGYDLIIMNYNNGSAAIQADAAGLIDLINHVNSNMDGDEKLVICGASMGGLVTRYALASMEQQGLQHNTRLFISFDSPQQGANIPLGVQEWIHYFSDNDLAPQKLIDAENILKTPAATQMLNQHYLNRTEVNSEGDCPNSARTVLLNQLNALGQYPHSPLLRKVAVSNGSGNALHQIGSGGNPMQPGNQIVQWNWTGPCYWDTPFGGHVYVGDGTIRGDAWAVNYWGDLLFWGKFDIPAHYYPEQVISCPSNLECYDAAPGGWRNTEGQLAVSTEHGGTITTAFPNHCFIPMISALDLRYTADNKRVNAYANLSTLAPGSVYTPFDDYYCDQGNNEHVTVTQGIAQYLLRQLEYRAPAPTNFNMVSFAPTEVVLEWDAVQNLVSYNICRGHAVGYQWVVDKVNVGLPAVNPQGKIRFTMNASNGLPANWGSYMFSVSAICQGGETATSNWFFIHDPKNLLGTVNGATSVKLTWVDDNIGEDGFQVWCSTDPNNYPAAPAATVGPVAPMNGIGQCIIDGLTVGQTYYFLIRTKKGASLTPGVSTVVKFSMPGQPSMYTELETGSVIGWGLGAGQTKPAIFVSTEPDQPGGTVTTIDIERKDGIDGPWQLIKQVVPQTRTSSMEIDYAEFNQDHYYRARSVNGMGSSSYTAEAHITRAQLYFRAPTITKVTPAVTGIRIDWLDSLQSQYITGPSAGFCVYWKKPSDTTWSRSIESNPYGTAGDVPAPLDPLTTYQAKVTRYLGSPAPDGVETEPSPVITVMIPADGMTDWNNARHLVHNGTTGLWGTFHTADQAYVARSVNNGVSWAVASAPCPTSTNPGLADPNNGKIYEIRVKQGPSYGPAYDTLFVDSMNVVGGVIHNCGSELIPQTWGRLISPVMAVDGSKRLHCIWIRDDGYHPTVMYAKRENGTWCYPVEVSQFWPACGYNTRPSLAVSAAGDVHIAWAASSSTNGGVSGGTSAIFYSYNLQAPANLVSSEYSNAVNPSLSLSATGLISLVWQESDYDLTNGTENREIYHITKTGTTWSLPVNVSGNSGVSELPVQTIADDGSITILWQDNSTSGYTDAVYPIGTPDKGGAPTPQDASALVWQSDATAKLQAKPDGTKGTNSVNPSQVFGRRYKNGYWSPVYRLTNTAEGCTYPALPPTDKASLIGFLYTQGSGVRYKQLPDIDPLAPQFATGFETADPIAFTDSVYQSSSVDGQIAGTVTAENGVTPHSGTKMYKIRGNDNNGVVVVPPDKMSGSQSRRSDDGAGNVTDLVKPAPDGKCFWQLYDPTVQIGGDMYLSFWLYVKSAPTNPAHIFVDAVTRSGKRLSLVKDPMYLCDTTGKRIDASLHTVPVGAWKNYIVNLSKGNYAQVGLENEVIDHLLLGYDDGANTEGGEFIAYLDDIAIKAGVPAPNKWIAAGFGNDANAIIGKLPQTNGVLLTLDNNGGTPVDWVNGPWLLYEFPAPQDISGCAMINWSEYDIAHAMHFALKVKGDDNIWRWLCYSANGQNHAGQIINGGSYGYVTMADPTETYNAWESFSRNINTDYQTLFGHIACAVGAYSLGHFSYASWTGDHGGSIKSVRIDDRGAKGGAQAVEAVLPVVYEDKLLGAQPNPCHATTTIRFSLKAPAKINLVVYNVAGQQVRVLEAGQRSAGIHSITWDGKDSSGKSVSAGMYLYRLQAGRFSDMGKLVLLR